jgi:DNA-binding response OmpR family regulator
VGVVIMTRILVVDDDAQFRRSVIRTLERVGYECAAASDGDEVMDAVPRVRPDLVLMDLTMPRRSGLEALRDLRAERDTSGIPVVMMTARSDLLPYVASLLGPNDAKIAKPFEPSDLERCVASALQRARSAGITGDA